MGPILHHPPWDSLVEFFSRVSITLYHHSEHVEDPNIILIFVLDSLSPQSNNRTEKSFSITPKHKNHNYLAKTKFMHLKKRIIMKIQ